MPPPTPARDSLIDVFETSTDARRLDLLHRNAKAGGMAYTELVDQCQISARTVSYRVRPSWAARLIEVSKHVSNFHTFSPEATHRLTADLAGMAGR